MTRLAVSYPIDVPGARIQAASSADRYVCALTAALAAAVRGKTLLGALRGDSQPVKTIEAALVQEGVDLRRAQMWEASLRKTAVQPLPPTNLGGLTLAPYQMSALNMLTNGGGVLAVDCGLGKTLMACAFAAMHGYREIVVLCPLNAMPTWHRAFKQFLPNNTTHTTQSMDSAHHLLGMQPFDLLICDEAHLLGDTTAARTKNAHALRLKAYAGLCLTGTLLHAGIHKALSALDLAIPGAAGFASKWSAGEHFHCLARKKIGGRTVTALTMPGEAQKPRFHEYLSRHCVAMTIHSDIVTQTLQLPGQTVHDIEIAKPWDPLHIAAAKLVQADLDAGATGIMTAAAAAHALCSAGVDEKTGWVVQNIEDEPVVIFANYTATLDMMQAKLEAAEITFVRVDGSVTGEARGECQRKFQAGEVQVFLGQITAASTAMDLFRAKYSITIDHPWRPADYAQSLARTHRRGQTEACHHFDLCANRLQRTVIDRLRLGAAFNAETAEYQEIKGALTTVPKA